MKVAMENHQIEMFIPPFKSGDLSYIESLKELLSKYVEFVKHNVKVDSYIIKKIEGVNSCILSTISDVKQANSQKAYEKICEFITTENNNIDWPSYTLNSYIPLIRLRYSENDLTNRKDIFHIPYSKRHNVSQQRFSITGVPCLYLSGCAFTAWLELNKPNFSNLWCAGFRATKDIKVLDMSIRLDTILKENNYADKLILYPFIIASSFSTKHYNCPFKVEYIISNILLQAIINSTEFVGIRYFSTKIHNYKSDYTWMASNIVIPACNESGKDYNIELASIFSLTFPQPCSSLIHSPNIGDVSCLGLPMNEFDKRCNLSEGIDHYEPRIFEIYPVTQFYNIDGYLRNDLSYSLIKD